MPSSEGFKSKRLEIGKKKRSQCQRGLRRESAAASLPVLWVRIPAGRNGYISFGIAVYCRVDVSVTGQSLVQRSPAGCGESE